MELEPNHENGLAIWVFVLTIVAIALILAEWALTR